MHPECRVWSCLGQQLVKRRLWCWLSIALLAQGKQIKYDVSERFPGTLQINTFIKTLHYYVNREHNPGSITFNLNHLLVLKIFSDTVAKNMNRNNYLYYIILLSPFNTFLVKHIDHCKKEISDHSARDDAG